MRACRKCGEIKALEEFCKNSLCLKGYEHTCKECKKTYDVKYAQENFHKRYKNNKAYRIKNPHKQRTAVKKWRETYKEKYKAHTILNHAIEKHGYKKPETCSLCGIKVRLHGHHKDYTKPLDVIWVCPKCHKRIHRESGNESL